MGKILLQTYKFIIFLTIAITINVTTARADYNLSGKFNIGQGAYVGAIAKETDTEPNNNALLIGDISAVEKNWLESDGKLSEEGIKKILRQAFSQKKITDKDFERESCLTAKKIGSKGSFNTLQLFLVNSSCQSTAGKQFIVKEARDGYKEALALNNIQAFPGMKELADPEKKLAGLPKVALALGFLSYKDDNNNTHYLAIMPMAKGRVLCDVVTDFRDNPTGKNAKKVEQAYFQLGLQMGNFHKRFSMPDPKQKIAKTIVHGDFHCFNVFFDENDGQVTLIDNETMVNTLKSPATPEDDILKPFYGMVSNVEPYERTSVIRGINLKKWHQLALKNYLKGYASAYPTNEQQQVIEELKEIFISSEAPRRYVTNPRNLENIKQTYVNPIFDELLKEKN